jgi:hypothetical protein
MRCGKCHLCGGKHSKANWIFLVKVRSDDKSMIRPNVVLRFTNSSPKKRAAPDVMDADLYGTTLPP